MIRHQPLGLFDQTFFARSRRHSPAIRRVHKTLIAACAPIALTALISIPTGTFAFSVAASHRSSTINVLRQWAAIRQYEVIWEPHTSNGVVNFPAAPKRMGSDFHAAVEALVSGKAYGRRNVYCVRPSEYEPHPIFDDDRRVIYVIARPTGNRCMFTYP